MKKGLMLKLLLLQVLLSVGQPPARNHSSLPVHMYGGNGCPTQQDRETIHNQISRNITSILEHSYSCGGTPGWRRVGYLDMTDPSQSCPPGLDLKYYSVRSCGRVTNNTGGCWSTFYTTGTTQYSRVCGRVRGYQLGSTSAFTFAAARDIDSDYVEGVSLTHGQVGSRIHIWTFVAARSEVYDGRYSEQFCPCVTTTAAQPPAFVGNDYFCESGLNSAWVEHRHVLYPADPLWDGQNCATSTCNCQFNNPPYFTKTLPAPTTDNIELRICMNHGSRYVDVPIDQVELFVQ